MISFIKFSYPTLKMPTQRVGNFGTSADTRVKNRRFFILFCALSLLCVCALPAPAKPGGPPGTNGSYTLIFAGQFTGDGHAAVGANSVAVIQGNVTDATTGATGKFKANNLALDDGHFTGTGTVMGIPVTITGRVEAADGKTILVPRIICTFSTAAGAGGRIVGEK